MRKIFQEIAIAYKRAFNQDAVLISEVDTSDQFV